MHAMHVIMYSKLYKSCINRIPVAHIQIHVLRVLES